MMDALTAVYFAAPALGLAVAASASALLVATQSWHGRYTLDPTVGPQKFHRAPTTRIGGLALAAGLLAAWAMLDGESQRLLGCILAASVPVLAAGTAEDLTKRVRVRPRLLAVLAGGTIACLLTGYELTHVDVPGLDTLLAWTPLAVAVTAFCIAGVSNAINIVDGFNGLAASVCVISTSAIGLIAWQLGDRTLVQLCLVTDAIAIGFLLLNFPFGKIFLGDGGAYLLGFLLAWLAVLLPMRHAEVSAWASLVICAYPILEVFFSAKRKFCRGKHGFDKPDRLHLHMLIYRRIARPTFARLDPALANALTTPLLLPYALLGCGAALFLFRDTASLVGAFLGLGLAYHLVYMRLIHFRWCLAWPGRVKPLAAASAH